VIPVNEPALGEQELRYVTECVESGWISSAGSYIERFEHGWAEACNRREGVAVANGTVALQLAVAVCGLPAGSEVILPSFTIMSCVLALLYSDCVPVLVDCDPETWCMDVDAVESAITERTSAVMPVHMYGHPVDMDRIVDVCRNRGLCLIEDAAEAHGSEYQRRDGNDGPEWLPCGSFGEASCFSFYANKLVTTGEGGMVLTDDSDIAARARSLRNLAFGRKERFVHEALGFNFRMTNIQAALGVAQLERFSQIVARKRENASVYSDAFADVSELQLPVEREWARSNFWMYGVVLADSVPFDAAEFGRRLRERGVDTRPFFTGMHEQPVLRERGLFKDADFPETERLSRRGLYLPSGLALDEEQISVVVAAVKDALIA
jgi:perosamine synthetase